MEELEKAMEVSQGDQGDGEAISEGDYEASRRAEEHSEGAQEGSTESQRKKRRKVRWDGVGLGSSRAALRDHEDDFTRAVQAAVRA